MAMSELQNAVGSGAHYRRRFSFTNNPFNPMEDFCGHDLVRRWAKVHLVPIGLS